MIKLCFYTILLPQMLFANLDYKIGQLLIPYVDATCIDESTYDFLSTYKPGGIILFKFSNSLHSQDQVKELTSGLQHQAEELNLPPLFICADQEGGRVTTLPDGFTHFMDNGKLGHIDSETLTYQSAKKVGVKMLEMGVNFNLAPVVDIHSHHANPIIGCRAYGSSPEIVAKHGLMATCGFAESGILSCLKHFPGHGGVDVDSHKALPILFKSRAEIEAFELIPFKAILNASPAIMTAHLRVPALDPHHCATLSKKIVTGLLRNDMGYRGLIVTDSLTMGAILEECSDIGEAALLAFEAGADLIIIGGRETELRYDPQHEKDLNAIQSSFIKAIKSGRITLKRLEESLSRIEAAKSNL